jgi:cobalamin biosynthesis Mg chelatase CobN
MRTKLMLEALAAWLALAVASGPACASIQSGANSVLTMAASPLVADPLTLDQITTLYSEAHVTANDSIRAKANVALLTPAPTRKGSSTRPTNGVSTPARGPFKVDARQSNAATDFSQPGADDFTPGRKNGYDTELKRRAVFKPHEAASQPQGVLVAANGGSDLDSGKFYLIANAKPAPVPRVPEPGSWATVLAGLLGVIAIARRRMSL